MKNALFIVSARVTGATTARADTKQLKTKIVIGAAYPFFEGDGGEENAGGLAK